MFIKNRIHFIEIRGNHNRKFLVGVVYRLPEVVFCDFYSIITNIVINYYDKITFSDWNVGLVSSAHAVYLQQLFDTWDLKLVSVLPTHHTEFSFILLDLCLVNNLLRTSNFHHFAVSFLAKHDFIGLTYSLSLAKLAPQSITRPRNDLKNVHVLKESFLLFVWQLFQSSMNLDFEDYKLHSF